MPMLRFQDDPDLQIANAFCAAALRYGIYLHPKHNMFLCSATRPMISTRHSKPRQGDEGYCPTRAAA
ncbi:hypothetical protein [Rhizobium sp. BG4]|uniref:hypothetical protein n=1 Tax=Rhizobium sp. BG4 TaxID=2613770 RepID=UPI001FEFBB32|nr:hypothetical protein [Rhizobium sp. BG4]